tara:strand:- start:309 stop:578 length:270 start_codon:yes stop_codon:yes gene_type:complete
MQFKVIKIIDGDTFEVLPMWKWNGHEGNIVRPTGYNAPEWGQLGFHVAKQKLENLILSKHVELRNPIKLTFKRLLCDVYYEGRNLASYF